MSNAEDHHTILADGQGTALPSFDPSRYRDALDGFDISDAQKQELLATLWSIMCGFVELGFRADVCTIVFGEGAKIPERDQIS